MITIGNKIGPYEVRGLLGQGGMAMVYKVWHTERNCFRALKTSLSPHANDEFAARLSLEARHNARLHHPHIVTIFDIENVPFPYFTMELIEGGDLADLIHRRGRLSLEETGSLLQQVASALDFAHHNGVLHRDVKPSNILLQNTSYGGYLAKVVDFGISRAQEQEDGTRLTKTGMFIGTPEYMSPEQAGSGARVDGRTDQYSLGIIAYEMLCGEPPFKAETDTSLLAVIIQHVRDEPRAPRELEPTLPQEANDVILRALSKDPVMRFGSCGEFIEALLAAIPYRTPVAAESPGRAAPVPAPPTVQGVLPTPVAPPTIQEASPVPLGETVATPIEKEVVPTSPIAVTVLSDEPRKEAVEKVTQEIAAPAGVTSPVQGSGFLASGLFRNLMLSVVGLGIVMILAGMFFNQKQNVPRRAQEPRPTFTPLPPPQAPPAPKPAPVVGTYTFADKSTYRGELLNGLPHGAGVKTRGDKSRVEGEWASGKLIRVIRELSYTGALKRPDGSTYHGQLLGGKMQGKGKLTRKAGLVLTGQFKDGRPVGAIVLTFGKKTEKLSPWTAAGENEVWRRWQPKQQPVRRGRTREGNPYRRKKPVDERRNGGTSSGMKSSSGKTSTAGPGLPPTR